MPTYTYQCRDCQKPLTRRLPIRERDDVFCCDCGGYFVRVPDAPAIQFKGSGFYVNDYKRKT